MNRGKQSKQPRSTGALAAFLLISLSFLGHFSILKAATAETEETVKTRRLENGNLDYHLRLVSKPHASYDGEAFLQKHGKTFSYVVVLNRAFFEKEAQQIFSDLQKAGKGEPSPAVFASLSDDLNSLGKQKRSEGPIHRIKELQSYLENLAWRSLYAKCSTGVPQVSDSFACFRDGFVQARLNTVEEHEVAHLIDLATRGDDGSDRFSQYTELNAFYAELLRGANPLDSMAQAFTGLIEERQKGKNVDYSTEKVRHVLKFLESCPRYRALMAQSKHPHCSLEILTQLSREDFSVAGGELQRQNNTL